MPTKSIINLKKSEETHLALSYPRRSVSKPSPDAEGAILDGTGLGTKSESELPGSRDAWVEAGDRTILWDQNEPGSQERYWASEKENVISWFWWLTPEELPSTLSTFNLYLNLKYSSCSVNGWCLPSQEKGSEKGEETHRLKLNQL